jgi:3-hydroxy-9,10-secoandrosta-1,3,5(10)-triene-9,17-dione monooxygenase
MSISPPEPDLTQEQIVERAQDMVALLRERQEECEELGRLPDQTSQDFIDAGFYRILQPRRFGGYEFDLPTFSRVAIELARGCPSSGWTYALTAGHAHLLSALFSEECQIEVYGDDGEVRMPGNIRFVPATVVEGGYRVSGAWDYVSGCDSATHYVLGAEVPATDSARPTRITFVVERDTCSIVDNWDVLGFRGTGSRQVVAEDVFVPTHRTLGSLFDSDLRSAPGRRVHENPIYVAGGLFSLLYSEITAVAVGTAKGALDLYEETLRTRKTTLLPSIPMKEHPDYHRFYGEAVQLIDVAEGALLSADRDYMEWSRRDVEEGIPFAPELEHRLGLRKQLCSKLAADAVNLMVRTGGSSAMKTGTMMGRYWRDMAMLSTHNTAQPEQGAGMYGRLHFGVPLQAPGEAGIQVPGPLSNPTPAKP